MGKNCLAVFLIFLLIICGFTWLTLFQSQAISEPVFLNKTLAKSGLFNEAPKIITKLTESMPKDEPQSKILSQLLLEIAKTDFLKNQTEKIVYGFLTYFRGKSTKLVVEIDLSPLKKSAEGTLNLPPDLAEGIVESLEQMPVCQTQMPEDQAFAAGCRPNTLDLTSLKTKASKGGSIIDQLPDNFDIGKQLLASNRQIQTTRERFHKTQVSFLIISILSIIMIGLIFLVSWNDFRASLRRTGIGLFVPGLIILILNSIGFFSPGILKPLVSNINGIDKDLLQELWIPGTSILKSLLTPGIQWAIVMSGLGFILMIVALFIPKLNPPQAFKKVLATEKN